MDIERRALTDDCELRLEDGRKLSGVALRFNVQASDRAERFAPGAFDLGGADVILGAGHPASERAIARTGGGGLDLDADDDALRFRAQLPDTREAREAVALVKARIFRNVSVEFKATRERMIAGVREIQKAILVGVVVLPRGAYADTSVDARSKQTGWRRERTWL